MSLTAHRVKFWKPDTSAICCLAYEREACLLAVGRSTSVVEIWSMRNNICFCAKILCSRGASLEALVWCKKRLFSTGFDGFVYEYSIERQLVSSATKVASSAAWCMQPSCSGDLLAVGTEDGTLTILGFSSSSGLEVQKLLPRVQQRVLCVAWSADDRFIVSGSVGQIFVCDVASGRCTHRLTLASETSKLDALVWCVQVTKDFTIISGDSLGKTSFWDGTTGTLLHAYQSHRADVLCLALDESQESVYAAGVDPLVCQFAKVDGSNYRTASKRVKSEAPSGGMWVEGVRRQMHTHSVRALAFGNDGFLLSGGVDALLTLSKYPPKVCISVAPPFADRMHISAELSLILFDYESFFEFWRLGESDKAVHAPSVRDGSVHHLRSEPVKLIEFKCRKGRRSACSALSDDGRYFAYSDDERTFLYQVLVDVPSSAASIRKITCTNAEVRPAKVLCFLPGKPARLLICDDEDVFGVYDIDDVICQLTRQWALQGVHGVSKIRTSLNGSHAAIVHNICDVQIMNVATNDVLCSLPREDAAVVDVQFANDDRLAVLYANGKVVEASVASKSYSAWCRRVHDALHKRLSATLFSDAPPLGLACSSGGDALLVYTESKIGCIDRTKDAADVRVRERFEMLACVKRLADAADCSVVVVQTDRPTFVARLPPALNIRKFGTG